MRNRFLRDLLRVPRSLIQTKARVAVALPEALDGDHQIGPDRLRTEVAAPDPACEGGHEKERERSQDQKPGDEVEFLRPDFEPEHKKAAVLHI